MSAQDLWDAYCLATGHKGALPEIDQFGDDPDMADALLALVLNDTKRATCCLARDFSTQSRPKPGDHWIITDGAGQASCIIKTTKIELVRICDVTDDFAFTEGEGDKSLSYWKREHDAYYRRQAAREGFVYDDKMIGICEEFERVWPND